MTDWDQLINDTGYELFFYEQQLVGGALEIGGTARVIEARETDGWELLQVGYRHWGTEGKVQLCFRRPYPDRDERVAHLIALRDELETRFNARMGLDARYQVVDVVDPIAAGVRDSWWNQG